VADQPGIVRRQKRRKKEREASADVRRLWYLTFGVMLSWHYGVASGHWGESGGFVACGCASPSSEELLVGMLWAVCCFAVGERWSAVVSGHFGVLSAARQVGVASGEGRRPVVLRVYREHCLSRRYAFFKHGPAGILYSGPRPQ